MDFSLLGDAYYDVNFNHPTSGVNGLYNFDTAADQARLNMAELTIDRAPGPVGFHLAFIAGHVADMISATDKAPDGMRYVKEAYVSYKPLKSYGLQLDFGKFVTSAGAEVIETNQDWNCSRSLLFSWAIPYYHMGLRTTIPVNKWFTAGVQIVNGWNDVRDNNSGKTVGVTGALTWKKVTWTNTVYAGPEKEHTDQGWRKLYDSVVTFTPTPNASLYFNTDFAADKNIGPGSGKWGGVAGAFRYQLNKRFAVSPRVEWFSDRDGLSTGVAQNIKEVTLTAEMKLHDNLLSRLEFRHDQSDHPFFDRGTGPASSKTQDTIALGLIAYFGPKK